jgi:hypothetical protein
MALALKDRVKETTIVVGTGAATLLGSSIGFQPFSVVGNGNTTYYCISDQFGLNWEVGIGTYTASGNTLARTTVLASSNGGALVVFTTGFKDVFVTYPSEKGVWLDASNNAIGLGTPAAFVGTNITGTASGLTAGNVTTNANLTGAITSSGNATSLGSFTSANLATALTDETGSGANVFATSPTLVTPALGTPTSGTLTNCTLPQLSASTGSTLVGTTNGGTGSVTRTVASKLNDTVSVKDFGAVGDGVTDDTAAINLALTYANTAVSGKYKILQFEPGTYLVVPGGLITIFCDIDGANTEIKAFNNTNAPLLTLGHATAGVVGQRIKLNALTGYGFNYSFTGTRYGQGIGWSMTAGQFSSQTTLDIFFIQGFLKGVNADCSNGSHIGTSTFNISTLWYCSVGFYSNCSSLQFENFIVNIVYMTACNSGIESYSIGAANNAQNVYHIACLELHNIAGTNGFSLAGANTVQNLFIVDSIFYNANTSYIVVTDGLTRGNEYRLPNVDYTKVASVGEVFKLDGLGLLYSSNPTRSIAYGASPAPTTGAAIWNIGDEYIVNNPAAEGVGSYRYTASGWLPSSTATNAKLSLGAGSIATNLAAGTSSLAVNTTGFENIGYGSGTLIKNTVGNYNVAIGASTLGNVVSGVLNTAVGAAALGNTTGSNNTAIGKLSGNGITSGTGNTIIGAYTGASAPISATGSYYVVLSDGGGNVRQTIDSAGKVGINTTSPNSLLHINGTTGLAVGAALTGDNAIIPSAGGIVLNGAGQAGLSTYAPIGNSTSVAAISQYFDSTDGFKRYLDIASVGATAGAGANIRFLTSTAGIATREIVRFTSAGGLNIGAFVNDPGAGNMIIAGINATSAAAPTIASATTIAPTKAITFISGVTPIVTITAPSPISLGGGTITLIPTGIFTTTTAGNIALASTAIVSKALIMTYDVTTAKWYPSY